MSCSKGGKILKFEVDIYQILLALSIGHFSWIDFIGSFLSNKMYTTD